MVRNSPKLITNQLLYQLSYIGVPAIYSNYSAPIAQRIYRNLRIVITARSHRN